MSLPSSSRLLKLCPSVSKSRFSPFHSWLTVDTISWEVAFRAAMELQRFLDGEAFKARREGKGRDKDNYYKATVAFYLLTFQSLVE